MNDWSAWIAVSELVRNVGIVVAGGIGLVMAGFRVTAANRQAEAALDQSMLARRGHVAELFKRAVGQLDDDRLQVRLGAIYTLREIAWDFPDLTAPVYDLLAAYLREARLDYGDDPPPVDVQEIVNVLVGKFGDRP